MKETLVTYFNGDEDKKSFIRFLFSDKIMMPNWAFIQSYYNHNKYRRPSTDEEIRDNKFELVIIL